MHRFSILLLICLLVIFAADAQQNLPEDYLPASFHKGRREAARKLMPENSVMVVFAAPERIFANDINYVYHQNADLYYFTGYKEPNAMLFIFKDEQKAPDGTTYAELFFVQKRDALAEQWNGRRLGIEGVRNKLGIMQAYNAGEFHNHPLDLSSFKAVIFGELPKGMTDHPGNTAELYDLVNAFLKRAGMPQDYSEALLGDLAWFARSASKENVDRFIRDFQRKAETIPAYAKNDVVRQIASLQKDQEFENIKDKIRALPVTRELYNEITGTLRQIKTPEELVLIRRAVEISCAGQNEVMKTLHANMSELEVQGLHEYIHKKYGAEEVGYGSIIGSGENGCILHYMENTKTRIGNEMLLMDVGASYHGYTADVTRTIPADGKFSPEERAIYQLVYDAQEAAFKLLKSGVQWLKVNQAARETIAEGLVKLGIIRDKADVRKYYPHGLGHHIGLDVHDRAASNVLQKDMVMTIEPGIYIPPGSDCDKKWWNIAVRIEDDVLIRENDYELLSVSAPRSIEAIEKLMAEKSVLDQFRLAPLPSDKKAF